MMRRNGLWMLAAGVVMMGAVAPVRVLGQAAHLATDAELQQMFDTKQYRACLQQSGRILAIRDAGRTYDLYAIHMRRGECYLNLNDPATAGVAYKAALDASASAAQAETARAMVALLKNCRGVNFVPQRGAQPPISVVDLASRKQAMKALFDQAFAAAGPAINQAGTAPTLAPMIQFIPQALDLHALEVGATGADAQTRPVLVALGEKARNMISSELRSVDLRVQVIQTRANQLVSSGNAVVTASDGSAWFATDMRLGLMPEDRESLRQMGPYLNDLGTAAARGKQLAQLFGADGSAWDPVIEEANKVLQHAQQVLSAD